VDRSGFQKIRNSNHLWRSRRLVLSLAALVVIAGSTCARAAESDPDHTPISWSSRSSKHAGGKLGSDNSGSTGWWFGSAGIALVLAACGVVSIAARKYLPQSSTPLLQVVGRVGLSPKHSIYLLRVDGRVLLVGAGPQGAPSYLGELSDTTSTAGERRDFFPAPEPLTSSRVAVSSPKNRPVGTGPGIRNGHLDIRLGDEE
jgi:hypothetical protein